MHPAYNDYRAWARHIIGPADDFRVWYLEPATIVVCVAAAEISPELLDDYLRIADEIRRVKAEEIEAAGGIASVLDWRHSQFTEAARQRSKDYYETSRTKGRIRARFMTLKPDDPRYQLNYRMLSMNVAVMDDHLPIQGVKEPSEAFEALGVQPPKLDATILALRGFFDA